MRRRLLLACALAAPLMAVSSFAPAQDSYPSKAVRIIVPFAAGGPADVYARYIGAAAHGDARPAVRDREPARRRRRHRHRRGGQGRARRLHAADDVQHADDQRVADAEQAVPADARLRRRSRRSTISDLVLVVHPSVPANTLREFIDARQGAARASSTTPPRAPGTPYHMAGELFKAMAGVDIVHVPYKGSSGARTDILGGQVQMMFDAIPTMAQQRPRRQGEGARHHRHHALRRAARACRPSPRPACPATRR